MLFADLLGKYVLVMDKNYLEGAALGSALQGSEVVGPFNDLREAFKAPRCSTHRRRGAHAG
jgi:hypothetical protein